MGANIVDMPTRPWTILSSFPLALLVGCGGGSSPAKCVAGATVACACMGQQSGVQTCTSSGTFAVCACATPTVDAGFAGGADGAATSSPDAPAGGGSDGMVGTGGVVGTGGATNSGGMTASGGTTSAGGTTTCGRNDGKRWQQRRGWRKWWRPASCAGLTATCGPSNESCCKSLLVPGGTYYRSYNGVDFTDKSYPATVADFYLDKYEITVGRFRQFVNAGMGTQANPPAAGAGANPLIAGLGLGLDVEH
jgi:hypothetical protein